MAIDTVCQTANTTGVFGVHSILFPSIKIEVKENHFTLYLLLLRLRFLALFQLTFIRNSSIFIYALEI